MIVKAFLTFIGKFWWVVIHSWIRSTQADNTLMLDHIILVTSIIVGYDIDLDHLIVEEINKWALKMSTFIPFSYLIYHLCIAAGVEILHNMDTMIEVQRTLDASLIKADENPMGHHRAPHLSF